MQLIIATGSDATIFPNGQAEIDYLWGQYRRMDNIDIVDEHFYRNPDWFLDSALATASHLATNTCYWFGNGRFYGWEGVGCCAGTCTHVWHYAHAVARLFPQLERSLREMADFGAGFDPCAVGDADFGFEFGGAGGEVHGSAVAQGLGGGQQVNGAVDDFG